MKQLTELERSGAFEQLEVLTSHANDTGIRLKKVSISNLYKLVREGIFKESHPLIDNAITFTVIEGNKIDMNKYDITRTVHEGDSVTFHTKDLYFQLTKEEYDRLIKSLE